MYRLTIAKAAVLVAAGLGGSAQAGILGGVGEAVGGVVGGVADTVGDVADGLAGGVADHATSSGSGVSAEVSVSGGKKAGVGVSADVKAKVGPTIAAGACANVSVGGSGGSGCGAQARQATPDTPKTPTNPDVARRNPDLDSVLPSGRDKTAPVGKLGADWLVGLVAYGSDNVPLGMITRVRTKASDGAMPTIIVQLDGKRSVQLRNAIAEIRPEGVWLVVPAGAVQKRASGRLTRLAIPG